MNGAPVVSTAGTGDAERVAGLVAEAFTPLDVAQWLVGDPGERRRRLHASFRIHVEHALRHGVVHVASEPSTERLLATAVWFPRVDETPEPPDYDARLTEAAGPHLARFRALDAAFEAHHPEAPHHHLAFLAVTPARQGGGLGSALLARHHDVLDAEGVAAYLEASSPGSRDLYARHGYALGAPFHPDGVGPPLWPMWRPPGG